VTEFDGKQRCDWVGSWENVDPLALAYHDEEWGVPSYDDAHLFEMLTLEGAQSGLNWMLILRKREGYRRAFAGFDAAKVARFGEGDVARLLQDASIVRNRMKIESTLANARAILAVREEFGTLSDYLWRFVDGAPVQNAWQQLTELPAATAQSRAMSREMKRRGFRFLGPTTCYSFMQAVGMVNDHTVGCFRYREIEALITA
jgi:DNA-3-methyladenine glycosylase I